jgi:chemotaxis protein methyltransferase CheR
MSPIDPQTDGPARSEEPGQRPAASRRPNTAESAGPLKRPPLARSPLVLAALSALPLTHGDLNEEQAAELQTLKAQIRSTVGFACEGYKERCLRRRIAVRMRACGVHTYGDYAGLLEQDATEYDRLVDALTINVSKFFRNPEVWQVVRERVLPDLYAMNTPVIRAWSAGAASGEEAYTVGMLAHDYAAEHAIADRIRVLATDIDRESLAYAQRGEYTDFAMTDIDPAVRDRWFEHDTVYRLRDEARRHVTFDTLDLIRDECPKGQHLIFCRNVIIYFERSVQEDLFRRFHEALEPGGFLVLGKVEALFGAASGLFQAVANRERVFRRL